LLGNPVELNVHYFESVDPHTKESTGETVPCYAPDNCPLCAIPKHKKSKRREGYAPAMVLNDKTRYWEQKVVVFTAGALGELEEIEEKADRRGWELEIDKQTRQGRSYPMRVKLRARDANKIFRVLPGEFDVTPVMEFTWKVIEALPDDFPIYEPIKNATLKPATTNKTLELNPEGAPLLAAKLAASGLTGLEAIVRGGKGRGDSTPPDTSTHAAASETPTLPAQSRPATATEAAAPTPDATPDAPPDPTRPATATEAAAPTPLVEEMDAPHPPEDYGAKRNIRTELTPEQEHTALREGAGKTVCRDYRGKMAEIQKKREANRKDGPVVIGDTLTELRERPPPQPSANGNHNGHRKGGAT